MPSSSRPERAPVALMLLLPAAIAWACGPVSQRESPTRPNVVLVSIDSLRADHLGCYGYDRETSPHIDRIAREGVLFETVVAETSWTLPSHVTMLTGLSSREHQVTFDGIRLAEERETLAELFRRAGYRTRAFVSAPYLHPVFGFEQGFEVYQVLGDTVYDQQGFELGATQTDPDWQQEKERSDRRWHRSRTSPELARRFDEAVDELAGEPFFLFVHLFDVHYDYDPPERYWRRFDPDYAGDLDPSDYHFNPAVHARMPARDLQHVIARYDGEIRWTDEHLGAMRESLEARGLDHETLLVVTSDHGEEFFEHGNKGHRQSLFDEQLLVPLVMRWPAGLPRGVRLPHQVRMSDIAPTLLELAGLPAGAEMSGRSLVSFLDGREPPVDLPALSYLVWPETAFWRSLRYPAWKQVHIDEPGKRTRSVFFDLEHDRSEQRAVRAGPRHAAAARELASRVEQSDAWRARLPSSEPQRVALSPEMRAALEAMGYVEVGTETAAE